MSEKIIEILTPVIMALLTALASLVLVAITAGKQMAIDWFKSRTSANQQAIVDRVAQEAHAYAERWGTTYGAEKLNTAINYASKELAARGIQVSAEKLRGMVESAWLDANRAPVKIENTTTTFQVGEKSEVTQIGDTLTIKPSEPVK